MFFPKGKNMYGNFIRGDVSHIQMTALKKSLYVRLNLMPVLKNKLQVFFQSPLTMNS